MMKIDIDERTDATVALIKAMKNVINEHSGMEVLEYKAAFALVIHSFLVSVSEESGVSYIWAENNFLNDLKIHLKVAQENHLKTKH